MQYGRFRIENSLDTPQTAASIGALLENEFEQSGMPAELPTAADWGYTFQTKIGKQTIDISVVDHDEDGFGSALEFPKNSNHIFIGQKQKKAIESAKAFLIEILDRIIAGSTLIWYSKIEWLEAFDIAFWQSPN